MEYFGQTQEDKVIAEYMRNKDNGKYVDIGASEPIKYSNTYLFYLKGWSGLVVEPHPHYKPMWKETRPKDIYIQSAITNYNGEAEMSSTAIVGSVIGDDYKYNLKKELYTVPCMTLNRLIELYPDYADCDFASIDIETSEDKLLEKCDFSIFKPKLIVIEYEMRHINYKVNWEHRLVDYYKLVTTVSNNAFYIRK